MRCLQPLGQLSKVCFISIRFLSGERGIRTPDDFRHNRVQAGHHKPLGHLPMAERAGFEPAVSFETHTRFPGEHLQPDSDTTPGCVWRRDRDSNPGWVFETHIRLAGERLQPDSATSPGVAKPSASPSNCGFLGTPGRNRICHVGIRNSLPLQSASGA